MTFEDWWATVPEYMKQDGIWNLVAYRKANSLFDLVWQDYRSLRRDFRG